MPHVIEVQNLSKAFGEIKAVQEVSFYAEEGEIYSLLGPNGAGKTTTIAILSTLLRPDSGDATILGHSILSDAAGVKAGLGVVPQDIALYEDLTARENLNFWGKMYGLRGSALKQRVGEVLELIDLTDRANGRVGKFSGGMKRRVNIGVALLHKPKVIYMDEPTVGIDPQSRRKILDSVIDLKKQGMTVLYTTHYMEEAQEISDFIGIMDHGKLIAQGTHGELVKLVGEVGRIRLALNVDSQPLVQLWQQVEGVKAVLPEQVEKPDNAETNLAAALTNPVYSVLAEDSNLALPRLFEAATTEGVRIVSVDIQEPNLEAVFLQLTGRALRD